MSVSLPALAPLFERHTAPVLHVGDAVRINVASSNGGWWVVVTELYEPNSVRGSFVCIGRGTRLWTASDLKTLPGCEHVDVQLGENEVTRFILGCELCGKAKSISSAHQCRPAD